MQRRMLLSLLPASLVLALSVRPAQAADPVRFSFDEMNAPGSSVLGLKFSEKLKSLDGRDASIVGFMAPPLKADADFLVLTKEPVSLCPFCNSDQDWPDSIIVVYLSQTQEFVQQNRLIEVRGRLELGSRTDPETGFVSLVRLVDARFSVV